MMRGKKKGKEQKQCQELLSHMPEPKPGSFLIYYSSKVLECLNKYLVNKIFFKTHTQNFTQRLD